MYMKKLNIVSIVGSQKGKIRKINQDNFLLNGKGTGKQLIDDIIDQTKSKEPFQMYGVFDGLGGESCGEEAASIATSIAHYYLNTLKDKVISDMDRLLALYFKDTNDQICQMAREKNIVASGTTAAILCLVNSVFYGANIGDTKVFLYRNHLLQQLSVDHTEYELRKRLFMQKEMRQQDLGSNRLTQYLGIDEEEMLIEPCYFKVTPKAKDILLLCSDGLTEKLTTKDILDVLEANKNVEAMLYALLEAAEQLNTRDNRTVMLLQVNRSFFA